MTADFSDFKASLQHLPDADIDVIEQAYVLACEAHEGQKRLDGQPYVTHVIETARIVALWQGDRDTIVAALLHDTVEDTKIVKADITERFGRRVGLLVEGVTKLTQVQFQLDQSLDSKIETLRRLFEVMRRDIRVIIIKFADRLHNIRTIDAFPSEARKERFARETMDVYYKLASHLGMRWLQREYAEICVPILFSDGEQLRAQRDALVAQSRATIDVFERSLNEHHADKHLVSLMSQSRDLNIFYAEAKLRSGDATSQDAYSIIATARMETDCYQLLRSFHSLFRPVSGAFHDYIAAPSETGYRSIHTSVHLPDGSLAEVRIRTAAMQTQGDLGIISNIFQHVDASLAPSFAWLQRSEDIDLQTRDDSGAFWEALESDILREAISVTINRHRLALPLGATALDAAYARLGRDAGKTMAVSLRGSPVGFSHALRDDDDLHITLDDVERVSFDWLNLVSTRYARLLIMEVLKQRNVSEKVLLGRALLQKEFDSFRKGLLQDLKTTQIASVKAYAHREQFDEVLAMVGEGALRPRDIVFLLFPEDSLSLQGSDACTQYSFRLQIRGVQDRQQILAQLTDVSRIHGVEILSTSVRFHPKTGIFTITFSGACVDRLRFADFIDALERQEMISSVQTMLPFRQRILLVGSFLTAFSVILLDILLLPFYEAWFSHLAILPRFILQVLPLLPILFVNTLLLNTLQHFVVRMRSDRWFLGVGFLLNILGLLLVLLRIIFLRNVEESLLPLLILFVLSLVYLGYKFFQTEALFEAMDERPSRTMSNREWSALKRRKYAGYLIRCLAVIIWGLEPIFIRYTPVNDLSPFLRTFLLGIGVLLPSIVFLLFKYMIRGRRLPSLSLPYDRYFVILVLGQIGYMYFKNASLLYTTGTNLLLFNNFSPLIGLLIAAVLWRHEIPYFRQPKNLLWILLLAVGAGLGSALLVYSSSVLPSSWSLVGDILAMISTFFDVLMTIGQIQYIKRHLKTDGLLLNAHIFFFLLLFTSPILIVLHFIGSSVLAGLTLERLLLGMGIGLFVGTGQLLNYEAFKRIDGYLAYMMFNLSILITFTMEVFVMRSVHPTPLLLLSGALIIGASVMAEYINARCQRQGI